MQGQPDHRGGQTAEQLVGVDGEQGRAEWNTEADGVVEVGDVEPEQQLHDQRYGTKDPDVGP
ncbi:Uncharacterised protein [Mycobacteroides abscessus subsp. massiliense]|nr:Uncharacterised protein [Mycobacteroides abscessus subsp. massiliense]